MKQTKQYRSKLEKKLKRRMLAIATMFAVVFGIVVAVESPAMAAYSDCPNNNFCIFENINGGGAHYNWNSSNFNVCVNIGAPWNDRASSIYNHFTSNWKVEVFRDANCLGGIVSVYSTWQGYVGPGQTLNLTGASNNDVASSWKARSL